MRGSGMLYRISPIEAALGSPVAASARTSSSVAIPSKEVIRILDSQFNEC